MSLLRSRTLGAIVAAVGLAVAASLPSTAPGWLFWTTVTASCLGAGRWGWLYERDF